MEKLNLINHIEEQLEFFVEKFINIGWSREDEYYLTKTVDFDVLPDANNKKYKRKLGVVLFPELLNYREEKEHVITPWIACQIEFEHEKSVKYPLEEKHVINAARYLKEEIAKFEWSSFYDEDAYRGSFSTEKRNGYVILKCYLNQNYPKGWWENHTM